ncbi:MAG: hypothetical protein A2V64_04870 [Bacteroidetes bacterium RBG_13_43_22]|nr:MAG: hypothetical protein A2V64_04870 [Bacteroidetes bacterium RBG_13_43_22]
MKIKKIVSAAIISCLATFMVYPQADSLATKKLQVSGAYLGMGFGAFKSGLGGVISGTFLLSNNWGISLRYNPNSMETKNMPDDYIDLVLGIPFLTNGIPSDNINAFSVHVVREFPTKTNLVRLGLELGPSFIKYEEAVFTPVDAWIPLLGSNYDVSHVPDNCIGFSIRGKIEFPLTRFAGLETAPYALINGLRSILGIDFVLTLGFLR